MLSKLPPWVEVGGFFLALIAGCVNAVGLLGFQHEAVSHLSGTATLLGVSVHSPLPSGSSLHLLGLLLSFVAGAVLSGVIVGEESLKLGRRYGVALLCEAGLLLASMWALHHHAPSGHYFASAACGLQNAMATTYSGAVIRTTHVTGLFTDLGLLLGACLRGKPLFGRKLILLSVLIVGFIAGGWVGAIGYQYWNYNALLIPALGCVALSCAYRVFKFLNLKQIGLE